MGKGSLKLEGIDPEGSGRSFMKVLRSLAIMLVAAGFASALFAQTQTGNVYGRVTDEQGGVLPGVSVTLSGIGAPQTTTTGAKGDFHFLNLSPGTYSVKTELSGFATVEHTNVIVNIGTNSEIAVAMKIASVATTITVSSESPILDTRKMTTGENFSSAQLNDIPTARNPWVILQQTPGVLVDRMDVGGNQGGQQDNYVGKGTDPTQNAWNVDGVTITDMAATGSSPTYYDFSQFQEMQATTGGTDASVAVPGVTLNLVTKRGTNEVHGDAHLFDTPGGLVANNTPNAYKQQAAQFGLGHASTTVSQIDDYGVDAGGPLWQDKAWLWGSYGKNQINLITTGGSTDKTTLENFAGKFNAQPIESNSFVMDYNRGNKIKFGRNAGPTRPQPTSWDQTGPTTIWSGQDSQVVGTSLVANVAWNYVAGGFQLIPENNPPFAASAENGYLDNNGVWQNTYLGEVIYRPQHQASAGLSYFFNTGSLGHELKFGFGYRNAFTKTNVFWPGNGNYVVLTGGTAPASTGYATLVRPGAPRSINKYYNAYLQDTITASNLTVNVGLRYDDQYGNNEPSQSPANLVDPVALPALSYAGGPTEFKMKNWEPRVGATYALGAEKHTLLRASYARYADQLGVSTVTHDNPVGTSYAYYYFYGSNPGNLTPAALGGQYRPPNNVNASNPALAVSPNTINRNLKDTTTDEFMVGADHQFMPELVAGLTYTYRLRKNFLWNAPDGYNGSNFSLVTPAGTPVYNYLGQQTGTLGAIYGLTGGVGAYPGIDGGSYETNRPGYKTTYNGVTLTLTKRLSHKWMANANVTYTSWKQHAGTCIDPTDLVGTGGNSCDNGDVYFGGAANSGAFSGVYINSKWAFDITGLYQLPMNFTVSANLYARQGYLLPYFATINVGDGLGRKSVVVQNSDNSRLNTPTQLDLRLAKVLPLFQKADLTLTMDVFNALNNDVVLQQRVKQVVASTKCPSQAATNGCSTGSTIQETMAPRTLRFGAQLSF